MDCVLFSPKYKCVFFIESKRFINGKTKERIESLEFDYQRIKENYQKVLDRWKGDFEITNKFAILLGDVWTEREETIQLKNDWLTEKYFRESYVKQIICFDDTKSEFKYKNSYENYHLLIAVKQI